ncbi:MAG: LysM domain-containing protein [Cyanobacteriota bacterium]
MDRKLGAQLNLKPDLDRDNSVVDFDDLWIKEPEAYSNAPGVYVRGDKDKENEIDALWSGVRETSVRRTPAALLLGIGFTAGVLITFIVSTILFWGTGPKVDTNNIDITKLETPVVEQTQQSINVPEDTLNNANNDHKKYKDLISYTIQPGDSLGRIAERFYKSSSPQYVNLIQKANNLKSAHSITAGDRLLIPVKK